jgi:urease accessory protein UreF
MRMFLAGFRIGVLCSFLLRPYTCYVVSWVENNVKAVLRCIKTGVLLLSHLQVKLEAEYARVT